MVGWLVSGKHWFWCYVIGKIDKKIEPFKLYVLYHLWLPHFITKLFFANPEYDSSWRHVPSRPELQREVDLLEITAEPIERVQRHHDGHQPGILYFILNPNIANDGLKKLFHKLKVLKLKELQT